MRNWNPDVAEVLAGLKLRLECVHRFVLDLFAPFYAHSYEILKGLGGCQ